MCLNQIPHVGTSKDIGSAGSPLEYINPFYFKPRKGYPSPSCSIIHTQVLGLLLFPKRFSLCCVIPAGDNGNISGTQWKLCHCLLKWCLLRSTGIDLRQIKKLRGKQIYQYYVVNECRLPCVRCVWPYV